MELGIYSFAELTPDEATGVAISPAERVSNLLEEIELADQLGLDVFGIGEHHRREFVVSAPAVVLAAGAQRSSRIRLTSAVSVLSSDDPVRLFEQFATLDLLSGGRAEIMAGRGSFIESFPLFGYDLNDYDELFEEKLELLLALRSSERVALERAAIARRSTTSPLYPRPLQDRSRSGSPSAAHRSLRSGLAASDCRWRSRSSAGSPSALRPSRRLHRQALRKAGYDPRLVPLSINSHGFIADTSQRAKEIAFGPIMAQMNAIGAERGWRPTPDKTSRPGKPCAARSSSAVPPR